MKAVAEKVKSLNKPVVLKDDIKKLEAAELAEAKKQGLEDFRYNNNDDMLQAIGLKVPA